MSNITLDFLINLGEIGTEQTVDQLINYLVSDVTLIESKKIDYALGLVETVDGMKRINHYLLNGTQIQRNYCTLYFNRRGHWPPVKRAFDLGLIDAIQAYSK